MRDFGDEISNADGNGARPDLRLTRRNLMSIGSILVGSLLEGCKFDTVINNYYFYNTPSCYLSGTKVLTRSGETEIEDLNVGDNLVVSDGRTKTILAIGRRQYRRRGREDWPQEILPVRISRGALGAERPHADLYVSQNHRMYFHGMLVRAVDMLSGNSITIDPCDRLDVLDYFHPYIGAEHDVMLAEGALAETLLLDSSASHAFDNSDELECFLSDGSVSKSFAPAYDYNMRGKRAMVWSHLRSAFAPWIDIRTNTDRVRDFLSERRTLPQS
jgi:Hint domain